MTKDELDSRIAKVRAARLEKLRMGASNPALTHEELDRVLPRRGGRLRTPEAICEEIVHLRREGLPFALIASKVHVAKTTCREIYARLTGEAE